MSRKIYQFCHVYWYSSTLLILYYLVGCGSGLDFAVASLVLVISNIVVHAKAEAGTNGILGNVD